MRLSEFNAASDTDARAVVRLCADIPWWVGGVVDGRPYPELAALLGRAGELADDWAGEDVGRALSQHPRIGEKHRGPVAEAALSAGEQGGVGASGDLHRRLGALNREYEARFGHVFLIRAAGRSGSEVVAELTRRLRNALTTSGSRPPANSRRSPCVDWSPP